MIVYDIKTINLINPISPPLSISTTFLSLSIGQNYPSKMHRVLQATDLASQPGVQRDQCDCCPYQRDNSAGISSLYFDFNWVISCGFILTNARWEISSLFLCCVICHDLLFPCLHDCGSSMFCELQEKIVGLPRCQTYRP